MDIKDNRTDEEKTKDRLLLLWLLKQMKEDGVTVTKEHLQTMVWAVQKYCDYLGVESFHFNDWEWKEEDDS